MALVVFMRGVNVGGHKRFQPSALAKELAEFGAVNIGAAGTFVIRKAVSQAALRSEILRRLPFEPELMICPARDVIELTDCDPFQGAITSKDVKGFVSVLVKRPRKLPQLPILQPASADWQVQVIGVRGQFVLSLWRKVGRTLVYPNEVVEKRFGVPATTRNWNTIGTICNVLES